MANIRYVYSPTLTGRWPLVDGTYVEFYNEPRAGDSPDEWGESGPGGVRESRRPKPDRGAPAAAVEIPVEAST